MTASDNTELSKFIADKEKRGRTKKIIALVLLVLLLLLLAWTGLYYQANRRLPIPFIGVRTQEVTPPQFLYAINGPEGAEALSKPIGVCVTKENRAYIVDDRIRGIRVYESEGRYLFTFNAIRSDETTRLMLPSDVVESPKGEIWVTDRRLRGIFIFKKDGTFVREYVPEGDGPESWGPMSVAFDARGNVYVTDIGIAEQHRVFAFDSQGAEIARWGSTVQADNLESSPGGFYYPNGIAVSKTGDVFVADSNNRRVQVFDQTGKAKYIIPTSGTPRGIVIDSEQRLLVVDALAHTIDVYTLKGARLTSFGTPGVGLGQFQFPNDVALDARGRIYVTDRENHQVQVWGWQTGIIPPIELPKKPAQWVICLSPLLLFLIPLLRRKRTFVVTEDFIEGMALAEKMNLMTERRFKWLVPAAEMDSYEGRTLQGVKLGDLLTGAPHSESDVVELMEKTGIARSTAILLTMAERTGRLATEDAELRGAAQSMGVEVYDRRTFLDAFGGGSSAAKDAD